MVDGGGLFLLAGYLSQGRLDFPPMITVAILNSVAFGVSCFVGLVAAKRNPKTVFPLGRFPVAAIPPMLFLSVGLILGLNGFMEYLISLGGEELDSYLADLVEQMTTLILDNPFASILTVVVVAPITEELFFRGLLLQGFKKRYSTSTAVMASTLLFSAAHLNPVQIPATILLGLYLSWLTLKTNSLIPAMLAHAFNNALGLFLIFLSRDAMSSAEASLPGWLTPVGILVAIGSLLVLSVALRSPSKEPASETI